MTPRDMDKLARLKDVFSLNFRITRIYATYLESFPEFITKEMMDTLTEDGYLSPASCIAAMLAEVFGIGTDGGILDRRLIREYLYPSVRMMDAKRYTLNPYYKNIQIPNVKDGAWELKQEHYPAYRGFIAGDMMIYDDFKEIPPLGFFPEDFYFPAVLEDGNEWMTLTPVDLDTSDEAIEAAQGKVVTYGLGLGYYAYMVSEKSTVESITVVEKSEKVINLFKKYILPQFSHPEKVIIVNEDAFEYAERVAPSEKYDLAFVDTWRDASDGLPMYERMKKLEHLSPDTRFMYWIENHILSRRRALNYAKVLELIETGADGAPKDFEEFLSLINGSLIE